MRAEGMGKVRSLSYLLPLLKLVAFRLTEMVRMCEVCRCPHADIEGGRAHCR